MSWFTNLFGGGKKTSASPTPDVAITSHPLVINPSSKQKEHRHAARLHRLHLAVEQGGHHPDDKDSIMAEIARRQAHLASLGHKPPVNVAEAEALVKKLQQGG